MMLICKTAEVRFKLYNLCQNNYFINFVFIFKINVMIIKIYKYLSRVIVQRFENVMIIKIYKYLSRVTIQRFEK